MKFNQVLQSKLFCGLSLVDINS